MDLGAFNKQVNRSFDNERLYKDWAEYRGDITNYILDHLEGCANKILVIGAGNCNDLALEPLQEKSESLILTDIDVEAMVDGLERQGLDGQFELVDYLGIEGTDIMASLDEVCQAFTKERYDQWLNDLVTTVNEDRFVWTKEAPSLVIVMPIYTQLVFRQVEYLLDERLKMGLNRLRQSTYAKKRLLEEMPKLIHAFNTSLFEMATQGAKLIIFSDFIEDSSSGPYSLGFNEVTFEAVYQGYFSAYGMGLGHFGLYDMAERLEAYGPKWFKWPLTAQRVLFVKGLCFDLVGTSV